MKTLLPMFARALRESVLMRLGLAMGTLALLSFFSIILSTVIADNGTGKASAINLSGSMRMMSYRMLSEVQQAAPRDTVNESIGQFDRRLQTLGRFVQAKSAGNDALSGTLEQVTARWSDSMRPLVRAAAEGNPAAGAQLAAELPGFVAQIDRIVLLIEEDLERKINFLRAAQFALLGIVIVISLITTWMLRQQLVRPLAALLAAARTVSQGSFAVRVAHVNDDELGRLGQAFNTMVGEIAGMYGNLEDKVAEKTQALTQSNDALELLYRTTQQLAAPDLTLDGIRAVLGNVESALALGHSMICLSEPEDVAARTVLGNLTPEERDRLCGGRECADCLQRADGGVVAQTRNAAGQPLQQLFVPLAGADGMRGTLPILVADAGTVTPEKARLLETVGRHVATALSNMRRAEEKHRLAVLEERAVIARELHDSIAQSLSYLKIQVARLEKCLDAPQEAAVVAEEIKRGLNAAYKELRELITTFRLRVDARGFNVALQETIEEFSGKLGFPVGLENALASVSLTGNEEMHVLRIIREALANIEKHAGATRARVSIRVDAATQHVEVEVADDGCGFDPAVTPPSHFGIAIMEGRAQSLGGRVRIDSRQPGGTTLTLAFQPQNYRAAGA